MANYVKFGMAWESYGHQTLELPDDIDPHDEEAVIDYIESQWESIPLPPGGGDYYLDDSDSLDREFIEIHMDCADKKGHKNPETSVAAPNATIKHKLGATNHSYYCSDVSFYDAGCHSRLSSWAAFKKTWLNGGTWDDDLNHLFRFDLFESEDKKEYQLELYLVLQRKGVFLPVIIQHVTENDFPEIEKFLEHRWEYMRKQWSEFSGA